MRNQYKWDWSIFLFKGKANNLKEVQMFFDVMKFQCMPQVWGSLDVKVKELQIFFYVMRFQSMLLMRGTFDVKKNVFFIVCLWFGLGFL
jgi:hypothetical protein